MTTLQSGQFVIDSVSGVDAGGNPAPVELHNFDVTNHAIAYAVQTGTMLTVVSRGPLGSFNVDLDFRSGAGLPVTGQTRNYTVVAGDAVEAVVSESTPAVVDSTVPPIPAGW